MRLMQACGIINTQDFCAWDLGLSWSARINYTVIQQKIYKSLKPPKFFFPSCNKLVSHSISPMEKPSISRMLSRSFSGGEMVVTPFSSLSSKMTRADLKESKLCRWVGQQLPDPIEDHKAPSGWQVWKNTSHLEVRVYICFLSELPLVIVIPKEPIWQPIWLSNTSLVKGLDVSHMIPLSLNAQIKGIASKVVELVHIDSSSPVADLATFPLATASIKKQNGLCGDWMDWIHCHFFAKLQSHKSKLSQLDDPSSHWTRSFATVLPLAVSSSFSWAAAEWSCNGKDLCELNKHICRFIKKLFQISFIFYSPLGPSCFGGSMSSWISSKSSPSASALSPACTNLWSQRTQEFAPECFSWNI